MNFKVLTIEQMNRVSSFWTASDRAWMFSKVPALAGIREDIDEAHGGLRVYVSVPAVISPQLLENRAQATTKDRGHDRSVRASIHLMQAAIELSPDEDEETMYRALLEVVYPDGFGTTGMSYEEEAGSADLRKKRLTDEHRDLLKGLTFRDTNALFLVEGAIESALALGELERQKRQLESELSGSSGGSASEAKRAQYNWIETAKMVVQHSSRALKKGRISQQEHDDFLEPLMHALQVADKKKTEREVTPEEDQITEDKKETD